MFDEAKHPRDDAGRFTYSDGNGGEHIATEAENKRLNELNIVSEKSKSIVEKKPFADQPSKKGNNKTKNEFFGEEFTGVKGADAVEKLLEEKHGYVKNAFERPEIGGIDLVWGDEQSGLLHTIERRNKLYSEGKGTIDGVSMVKLIPKIIENGRFSLGGNDRPVIEHDGFKVIIKPTYDGIRLNWILSAMENYK